MRDLGTEIVAWLYDYDSRINFYDDAKTKDGKEVLYVETKHLDRDGLKALEKELQKEFGKGVTVRDAKSEYAPEQKKTVIVIDNSTDEVVDKDNYLKESKKDDAKIKIKIEAIVSNDLDEKVVSGNIEDKYDEQTLEDWYDFAATVEGIINRKFIVKNISLSKNPESISEYIDFYGKDENGDKKEGLVDLRLSDHPSNSNIRRNRIKNVEKVDKNYRLVSVIVNNKRFDSYSSALKYVKEFLDKLGESLKNKSIKESITIKKETGIKSVGQETPKKDAIFYTVHVFNTRGKNGHNLVADNAEDIFDEIYFSTPEEAKEFADKRFPDAYSVMIRDNRGTAYDDYSVSGAYMERVDGSWKKLGRGLKEARGNYGHNYYYRLGKMGKGALKEDTVKTKSGKWVNKGDTGETHGTFKTKKSADAQRKAMFAQGYKTKEGLDESKTRTIRIYGDGKYLFSTDRFSKIKDAIDDFKSKGEITVVSRPSNKTVRFSDYKKVTGEFLENLKESIGEEVRAWWDSVESWNRNHGFKYVIDNYGVEDEDLLTAMYDMLQEIKNDDADLYRRGKRIYNKYAKSKATESDEPLKESTDKFNGKSFDAQFRKYLRELGYKEDKDNRMVDNGADVYTYWNGKSSNSMVQVWVKDGKITEIRGNIRESLREEKVSSKLPYDDLSYEEGQLAEYLFDEYAETRGRHGSYISVNLPETTALLDEVHQYYDDRITKKQLNNVVNALTVDADVEVYDKGLQLSDDPMLQLINVDIPEDEYDAFDAYYWQEVDKWLEKFNKENGVETSYTGRSGRHVIIDMTVENFINYKVLRDRFDNLKREFVKHIESKALDESLKEDRVAKVDGMNILEYVDNLMKTYGMSEEDAWNEADVAFSLVESIDENLPGFIKYKSWLLKNHKKDTKESYYDYLEEVDPQFKTMPYKMKAQQADSMFNHRFVNLYGKRELGNLVHEGIEDNITKETIRTPRGTFELYSGSFKDFKAEDDFEDWGFWFDHYYPDDAAWADTEKWYKVFHNHKNNHAIVVLFRDMTKKVRESGCRVIKESDETISNLSDEQKDDIKYFVEETLNGGYKYGVDAEIEVGDRKYELYSESTYENRYTGVQLRYSIILGDSIVDIVNTFVPNKRYLNQSIKDDTNAITKVIEKDLQNK